MPTIVLADDPHLVPQSFRLLLETQPESWVSGEVTSGLEAVELGIPVFCNAKYRELLRKIP